MSAFFWVNALSYLLYFALMCFTCHSCDILHSVCDTCQKNISSSFCYKNYGPLCFLILEESLKAWLVLYVNSLQEIVPLNAGNVFGPEDGRPVPRWENIIREVLNRIRPMATNRKCFSDPPSPSKFKPCDDNPDIEAEILLESESDVGEEVHPLEEDSKGFDEAKDSPITEQNAYVNTGVSDCTGGAKLGFPGEEEIQREYYSPKRLDRLNCLKIEDVETSVPQHRGKLTKILSGSERIGLSWPEAPLNLLSQRVLERPNSFRPNQSFKASKSFGTYSSFKSMHPEIDFKSLLKMKRRSSFVRIISKQMVGIFLTVWVRRSLRKHIQNLKVSTAGVGVMGYIGNKVCLCSLAFFQYLWFHYDNYNS